MIKADYKLDHPRKEFLQLSKALGGTIKGNRWSYHNDIIRGYMEYDELDDGLFLYSYETFCNKKVTIIRKPTLNNTSFILNYEFSVTASKVLVRSSEPINELSGNKFTGIFFASSKTGAEFQQPWHLKITGIKIALYKDWIEKHFGSENETEKNFIDIMLKMDRPVYLFEFMDAHSAELVNEIFISKKETIFRKVELLQLTLDLLKTFFLRIANRDLNLSREFHFKDLQLIFEAQQYLMKDFSRPCPTLPELCTRASMSSSKFARMFRQVFGNTVHQYYQSARMMKARELLETGKYSGQEVSLKVGYEHQGKFAVAFKKQFNYSPKQAFKFHLNILEQK